ncbi:class I SAM-dependent methyltransferase [Halorarius halobius]|uniref:class I SAM-dependent methyltransferase n=1 Tax=Halorarius halobius TaxID=2962671 RepID=UPI0020CFDD80|nr:class I SAM-dependent methyltransferase [Halorarius halobius]
MNPVESAIRTYQRGGLKLLSRESSKYAISQFLRLPIIDSIAFQRSLKEIQKRAEQEEGIDDVLDTILDVQPGYGEYKLTALQLRDELLELARNVQQHEPKVILEIGTANGGTFYTWCRHVQSLEHIVSLDLPGGRFGGGYNQKKTEIFKTFSDDATMDFIRDDSHNETTLERIKMDVVGENKVDFLFIDGDHSYEGVKSDFQMYKNLMSDDGLVAFHDIVFHPDNQSAVKEIARRSDAEDRHLEWGSAHPGVNVHQFWQEIREKYTTDEIISHPDQTWGGIGLIYL